jgi:preprotein translocase SecE subunit
VARNRKRAKQRRARRPELDPSIRPSLATARADRDSLRDAPSPLEHATPDAELADAQLALGRPDMTSDPAPEPDQVGRRRTRRSESDDDPAAAELTASTAAPPARRRSLAARLVTFLQGSWRELQRVQWPDRRQVMQATGVVIGFVIVAGVYLAVADTLAGKLVNLVIK